MVLSDIFVLTVPTLFVPSLKSLGQSVMFCALLIIVFLRDRNGEDKTDKWKTENS